MVNSSALEGVAQERPILFSGEMVRAILRDVDPKTMTRRVMKPQPTLNDSPTGPMWGHRDLCGEFAEHVFGACAAQLIRCPYGVPGSKLWVRETWREDSPDDPERAIYRADPENALLAESQIGFRWKPSIFMPRWASRITLEVLGVRVERLQDISAKDILTEGAVLRAHDDQFGHNPVSAFDGKVYLDLRSLWANGWNSINGKTYPWASNPWTWVISFKRSAPKPSASEE